MDANSGGTAPFTATRQKAHRYGLASVDMEEALRYLEAYESLEAMDESEGNSVWFHARKGLLCAAIVAYYRPFKTSYTTGYADPRIMPGDLPRLQKHLALHELVATKRDKFIAHAEWPARSAKILNAGPGFSSWQFPQPNLWENLDVKEFRQMIEDVFKDCFDIGDELAALAHQENLKSTKPCHDE